ncbi:hypothetical protein [Salinisphaera sp. T31B1]|uniref:hypothetical protein n=1 Tax=Salinisphaera sp. T31B1 TaxID=727963 RepID=UPI003341DAC0
MQSIDFVSRASGYWVVIIDGVESEQTHRDQHKAAARVATAVLQGHAAHYEPRGIEIHGQLSGAPDEGEGSESETPFQDPAPDDETDNSTDNDSPQMLPANLTVEVGDRVSFSGPTTGQYYNWAGDALVSVYGTNLGVFDAVAPGKGSVFQYKPGGGRYAAAIKIVESSGRDPLLHTRYGVTPLDAETPPADAGPEKPDTAPPAVGDREPLTRRVVTPDCEGDPVHVHAVINQPDGSTREYEADVPPGVMHRLNNGRDDLSWLLIHHGPEGAIAPEATIMNTPADIDCADLTIIAPDGSTLCEGPRTIYAGGGNHVLRYKPVELDPDAPLHLLPALDVDRLGQITISPKEYASHMGPNGTGGFKQGMGDTGPHPGIGAVTRFDGPLLCDLQAGREPTAQNIQVCLDHANAACVYPFGRRDPYTLKPLSIVEYPDASTLWQHIGKPGNPIKTLGKSSNPVDTSQHAAHGPLFFGVATTVFKDTIYRERLALWANAQVLGQNENFRGYEKGLTVNTHQQARALAWSTRTVAFASLVCPEYADYFRSMIDNSLVEFRRRTADRAGRIAIWNHDLGDNKGNKWSYSNFMGWFVAYTTAQLAEWGFEGWADEARWLTECTCQQINGKWWPAATYYHPKVLRDDGNLVADWDEALQETRKVDKSLDAAFAFEPGSLEFIRTIVGGYDRYISTDYMGYPWQSDGFCANIRLAVWAADKYTPEGMASPVANYLAHERVEYGNSAQFCLSLKTS